MCRIFRELGHEVAVSANFGLHGSTVDWRGTQIYPRYRGGLGQDVVNIHAKHFGADVILTLYDIWVLPDDIRSKLPVPWIGLVPVDGTPVSEKMFRVARTIDYPIAYSRFGQREMEKVGLKCSYIPHGFDTSILSPGDKWKARDRLEIPYEKFVIMTVAANKGYPCRKGWPEMLEAYSIFAQRHPDAWLYLHTTNLPFGSAGEGMDIKSYMKFLGMPPDRWSLISEPDLALGVPEEHLVDFYRAADVFLLPSLGEGFGMPIMEAQACGCPVIVQNCSATAELCVNGIAIEPLQHLWLPQLGYYWQLPSVKRIVEALETVYNQEPSEQFWAAKRREGIQFVREGYDWEIVRGYWEHFFASVVEPCLW